MSILDRMTDADLKALVAKKNAEIQRLLERVMFLESERTRLEKWSNAKSRRIQTLMEDLNEFRRKEAQPQ